MTPLDLTTRIDQTIFADRPDGHSAAGIPGDCFRACLAMLAGTALEDAPHAVLYVSWFDVARRFIREHLPGLDLLCYDWDGSSSLYRDGVARPVIAGGPSPRGPFHHAVIANSVDGSLWHDPHPSRAGLLAIDSAIALVPLADGNPALPEPLALTAGVAA